MLKDSKACVADFNGDAAGLVSGGSAGESPDGFGVVDIERIDGEEGVRGLVCGWAMETSGAFGLGFGEVVCDWLEAGVVFGWQKC